MNPNKCTCLTCLSSFYFALWQFNLVFSCQNVNPPHYHLLNIFLKHHYLLLFKKKKRQESASSEGFGVSPPDRVSVELEDLLWCFLTDYYTLLQLMNRKRSFGWWHHYSVVCTVNSKSHQSSTFLFLSCSGVCDNLTLCVDGTGHSTEQATHRQACIHKSHTGSVQRARQEWTIIM